MRILNLFLCESHERNYNVCQRRQKKRERESAHHQHLCALVPANLTPSRKYFFQAGGPRRKWKFHIWIFSHSHPSLRLLHGLPAAGGTELEIRDNSNVTPCHPALISDDGTLVFFARPLYQGCHPTFFGKGVVLPSTTFFFVLALCCKLLHFNLRFSRESNFQNQSIICTTNADKRILAEEINNISDLNNLQFFKYLALLFPKMQSGKLEGNVRWRLTITYLWITWLNIIWNKMTSK